MTSGHPNPEQDPAAFLDAEGRDPQETAGPGPRAATADPVVEPGEQMADDSPTELVADLAAAQTKVAALTEDLQRLQAEYVNYKRRVDRDRELVKQNATFSVLSAMLPVLDDLDRAREHGELEGGFKAVADSLERIVAAHGLVKFGRPGDPFDPTIHEALSHIGEDPEVTVTTCKVIAKAGYRIGDRVVRAAQVLVVDPVSGAVPAQEPATEPPSDEQSE